MTTHPADCECIPCQVARASAGDPEEAKRYWAMVQAVKEQPREYRRGKPVVSKGCKGCHGVRR